MQKRIENITRLSSSMVLRELHLAHSKYGLLFSTTANKEYILQVEAKRKSFIYRCSGFTLIELMVVVVIVAIFAAIAIPSYQAQVRKAQAAQAQQEVQRIANELERWKSRNFNYLGYNLAAKTINGYASFTVTDGLEPTKALTDSNVAGQSWVIVAENADDSNYSFLMTSTGIQCKNKSYDNIEDNIKGADDASCGTGAETW